jgi:hypothetical protein
MATTLVERRRKQDSVLKVPKSLRKGEERVKNIIGFTPFDISQARKATNLALKFMKVANQNPDNAVDKVIEVINESKGTNPELVRWALMVFISNHPELARWALMVFISHHLADSLRIPSLVNRASEVSVPEKQPIPSTAPGPIESGKSAAPPAQHEDGEKLFNRREDPNFNEHRNVVHPSSEVPDPNNSDNVTLNDRHGELFVHMNRQMLARLDIERQALGLPLIQSLENLREPNDHTPFGSRAPNQKLDDEKFTVDKVEKNRKTIEETIKNGKFPDGTEITPDLLGSAIESSVLEYGKDPGHVIHNPRVAARDPEFWRWHRYMDDLFNKWQETQSPHDFSDAPPVNIREGDIILAFKDELSITHGATQDKEATEFGEKTFGGHNFNTDLSGSEIVTHELHTKMKQKKCTMVDNSGETVDIEHLSPRDYYYYFRVENTSSSKLDATFRVYLAPEELANSRRHWIEMDKFKQTLPPKSKTVVCRDSDMSSIISQPPQKTKDEFDDTATQPFHLLFPRGREEGMKFKLLVFITDWSTDEVPTLSRCKYPDSRPMDYPFDKPFRDNSYEETFKRLKNATIKDVSIKWVNDIPKIAVKA